MGRIRGIIDALLAPALDMLYPPVCLVCESAEPDGPEQVCENCWRRLMALSQAQSAPQSAGGSVGKALRVVSLASYDPPLEELIKHFKYEGFTALGVRLARSLLETRRSALESLAAGADALLPTPLHIVNYKKRGFNQAEIISDILSEGLSLPVAQDALAKVVRTKNQSLLSYEERLENLAGAFAGNPDQLEGRRVILVDDVITTGATIREVGATAEEVGAKIVGAISLASALDHIPETVSGVADSDEAAA